MSVSQGNNLISFFSSEFRAFIYSVEIIICTGDIAHIPRAITFDKIHIVIVYKFAKSVRKGGIVKGNVFNDRQCCNVILN